MYQPVAAWRAMVAAYGPECYNGAVRFEHVLTNPSCPGDALLLQSAQAQPSERSEHAKRARVRVLPQAGSIPRGRSSFRAGLRVGNRS